MTIARRFIAMLVVLAVMAGLLTVALMLPSTVAIGATTNGAASVDPAVLGMGLMAAAIVTAIAAAGAGFAVARVATAAIGALAEKPELFGRLLIFVGLAEGIAIYGLIVSILILNRLA
ncbi:MAG TPA: ATP synthase subunit C [Casimicrobiaceae bacterium]|nr:ATP synthase subunit C [Casimicrobiaceae bacterium]